MPMPSDTNIPQIPIPLPRISIGRISVTNAVAPVGAKPTEGVHRLLSMVNILPKKPVRFGSKSLYTKPEKTYKLEYQNNLRGKISELLVFDYALKESEVQKIHIDGYNENTTTFEPIINIPFNKRFGDFYVDISKKSKI